MTVELLCWGLEDRDLSKPLLRAGIGCVEH